MGVQEHVVKGHWASGRRDDDHLSWEHRAEQGIQDVEFGRLQVHCKRSETYIYTSTRLCDCSRGHVLDTLRTLISTTQFKTIRSQFRIIYTTSFVHRNPILMTSSSGKGPS